MVASCPFVKANEPHYLDRFTPEVIIFYKYKQNFIDYISYSVNELLDSQSQLCD